MRTRTWTALAIILFIAHSWLVAPAAGHSPDEPRTLHFPADRSIGRILTVKAPSDPRYGAELGPAKGDVHIPVGKAVCLAVDAGVSDISSLSRLKPDDLQALSLRGENIRDADLAAVKGLSGLEYLDLSATGITDAGLVQLGGMTKLKWLTLRSTAITTAGLAALAGMTQLEVLDVSGTQIDDSAAIFLCRMPALRHLQIQDAGITEAGMAPFANRHFESFSCGGDKVTDRGIANIRADSIRIWNGRNISDKGLAALAKNPNLKGLDVSSASITGSGLAAFKGHPHLSRLSLDFTPVGDDALAFLPEIPHLASLRLPATKVTDAGLASLRKCKRLRQLNLYKTGVTDAGMADLAELTKLEFLQLGNCRKITDAGIAKLAVLPRLRLIDVRGTAVTPEGLGLLVHLDSHRKTVPAAPAADASSSGGKLEAILKRLNAAVERACADAGITKEDMEIYLQHQAPPADLLKRFEAARPAVTKARRAAIDEMAALGVDAVPSLLRAKDESLAGRRQGDIFTEPLRRIGRPAVPGLIEALSDPNVLVRLRAIMALAQSGDSRAVEPLLRLMDEDERMTANVVWAFSFLRDPRAVEPLLQLWDGGVNRGSVVSALGNQRDRRAAARIMAEGERCLAEAEKTGKWDAEQHMIGCCALALGRIHDPAAIPLLKKMLQAGPTRVKGGRTTYLAAHAAANALRDFGFQVHGDPERGGYRIVAEPAANNAELESKIAASQGRLKAAIAKAYHDAGLADPNERPRGPQSSQWAPAVEIPRIQPEVQEKIDQAIRTARAVSADELAALGPDAVPLLVKREWQGVGDEFLAALLKIGRPATPALLAAMTDRDFSARLRANIALLQIDREAAIDHAVELLDEKNPELVAYGAYALGHMHGSQKAKDALMRAYDRGLSKSAIAFALAGLGDTRAIRPLIAVVEECFAEAERTGNWNKDESQMEVCASHLGNFGDPQAIPVLKKLLAAGPRDTKVGKDYRLAEAAAKALRKFGFRVEGDLRIGAYRVFAEPRGVAKQTIDDRSPQAVKIKEIVDRLSETIKRIYRDVGLNTSDRSVMTPPQPPPTVKDGASINIDLRWLALEKAKPAVMKARAAAAEEIAALGPDAVPALLRSRAEHQSPQVDGDVYLQALTKMGKPVAPVLLFALWDPNPVVRSRALCALNQLQIKNDRQAVQAVPALIGALSTSDVSVRADIVLGLALIDDPRALDTILRLLQESVDADATRRTDERMTLAVARAYGAMRDARAVTLLLAAWDRDLAPKRELAWALANQGDKRAIGRIVAECERYVVDAQRSGDWDKGSNAALAYMGALRRFRDTEAIPVLTKMLAAGPQRTKVGDRFNVAQNAADVLRAFGLRVEGDAKKGGYRVLAEPPDEKTIGRGNERG